MDINSNNSFVIFKIKNWEKRKRKRRRNEKVLQKCFDT